MLESAWLIPAPPLVGFLFLAILGRRLSHPVVAMAGVGSSAVSAVIAILVGLSFFTNPPAGGSFTQVIGAWITEGSFAPTYALRIDSLSVVMTLVVTVVGFFIHLYSAEFMAEDEDFSRYFAYMNLFLCAMLVLVTADNLLFLYLGWEGVGLCSFLLIGFWYKEPENARAAIKAFLVTRIGDTGMAVGLFLLFFSLGTLQIQDVMARASEQWAVGSPIAIAAAALLLCGALGKSAQLPLQTWLPDAMAGPTPVSALIHAATMVTAGVYLLARTHVLFNLAPPVMTAVAVIGAATLLLAGFSALTQYDIKRVLAYSTISQIGYMFLALGVGAWNAAIFHLTTHAFFKALLFLGAGAILHSASHEKDMRRLGGLRRELPVTFWTFLIGAASLAAIPLITGGFYSKEMVLSAAWFSPIGSRWLWLAGIVGAVITGVYAFRMVIMTFFGEVKTPVAHKPGKLMSLSLVVLAVGAIATGLLGIPETMGGHQMISGLMGAALPGLSVGHVPMAVEATLQVVGSAACLLGVAVAFIVFYARPGLADTILRNSVAEALHRLWTAGWGFDYLYDLALVRPFTFVSHLNKSDVVDLMYRAVAWLHGQAHYALAGSQTGRLRRYAAGLALGVIIAIGIVVLS